MTTPARTPQEPLHHIKSAARKLPIKRKANPNDSSSPLNNPNDPLPRQPFSIIVDDGEGHGGSVYAAGDDPSGDSSDGGDSADVVAGAAAVPFKFQRIWSEADEVRFLKGLLACHGQGMVFPRDLNVFFDRFSETMAQPYTRSQLSEKLRRLRKKFRIASSRITRGLDVAALSGHDRELFELSTRLWNPSFSDSSPFGSSGPDASKRRRRLPPPTEYAKQGNVVPLVLPKSAGSGSLQTPGSSAGVGDNGCVDSKHCQGHEKSPIGTEAESSGASVKHMVVKAVLDVFDSSLKEVKISSGQHGDLTKKWEEQRFLELNVLARRLRLVIEDAFQE